MTKNGDGGVFIKCRSSLCTHILPNIQKLTIAIGTFRLVVFRPFVGEILIGWVSSCTEEGLNSKQLGSSHFEPH